MNPQELIRKYTFEIKAHNEAYFIHDEPTISDAEYDQLNRKLVELEKQYPEYVLNETPTKTVGALMPKEISIIKHKTPMLSLDNVFSTQELRDWISDIVNKLGHFPRFLTEVKYDGLALSLQYKYGKLVSAATRGDGSLGEDVTANAMLMDTIPKELNKFTDHELVVVRGECLMPLDAFVNINLLRKSEGQKAFVNSRNAAAGSLRKSDPEEFRKRGLIFLAYGLILESDAPSKDINTRKELLDLGFSMSRLGFAILNMEEIETVVKEYTLARPGLPYDIDGIVISVFTRKDRKKLGETSSFPRWAIAYKFPADTAKSKLLDVVYQVGRMGAITPVAKITPTFCGGVTISSVTLHNEDELQRLGIQLNDDIVIQRAGDVIPQIVSCTATDESVPLMFPKVCPVCGSPIVRHEGESTNWCTGGINCDAQRVGALVHFGCKAALDIDGLGRSTVEDLLGSEQVLCRASLFTMDVHEMANLPGWGEKTAKKLVANIENAKKTTLPRFLYSLGIRDIGKSVSRDLAEYFGTLEAIQLAKIEDLLEVPDVGPVIAKRVYDSFRDTRIMQQIDDLRSVGVTWPDAVSKEGDDTLRTELASTISSLAERMLVESKYYSVLTEHLISFLKDKTFVFTGSLSTSRSVWENDIRNLGGNVSSSVSKKTDYLVAGDNAGSKLDKAKKLGVSILSEAELMALLNGMDKPN